MPILQERIYIDDIMFGAKSTEEAIECRIQVTELLSAGKFTPRKWASNVPRLLEGIPRENHGLAQKIPFKTNEGLKILGAMWTPSDDTFRIKVSLVASSVWTKRTVLANIAKIYDPL